MKVYKTIKETTISYRETLPGDNENISTEFALYVGDIFFINETGYWWRTKQERNNMYEKVIYKKYNVLDKLYYKKSYFTEQNKKDHMCWIENINVLNPLINNMEIENCVGTILEDVTLNWEREAKLKRILKL